MIFISDISRLRIWHLLALFSRLLIDSLAVDRGGDRWLVTQCSYWPSKPNPDSRAGDTGSRTRGVHDVPSSEGINQRVIVGPRISRSSRCELAYIPRPRG